ncbi:MAG: Ig-like domain-containing protein [Dehalococcoidia bacterium]
MRPVTPRFGGGASALVTRLPVLVGVLVIVAWGLAHTEAAPPAGQVPIDTTYVDTPYLLRTLEVNAGTGTACRFLLEVARPRWQVQLHDSRVNPPLRLTYTVPDPNLGFFEDVLDGTTATPPAGSHWMLIGSQRAANVGGGCSTADASFRADWLIDWVRAAATTPTPTPSPSPTPPPTADFTWTATAPNTVAFDGSPSTAVPPATIVGYNWNFGSPPASTEQKPTHVFPAPGLYDVTLTVQDSNGQTDPVTKQVRVLGEPVVNSLADKPLSDLTSKLCDTGGTIGDPPVPECTLRAAIQAVNNGGGASIKFNIAASSPTIALLSALPEVTSTVSIDGRTQSGGWVTIDGSGASGADGLVFRAGSNQVHGLALTSFAESAIVLAGSGSTVAGNRLGTDVSGSASASVKWGVVIIGGGNTIGGGSPADMNVILGSSAGLQLSSGDGNAVRGNRIGVNTAGTAVLVSGGSFGVLVGGSDTTPARNTTIADNVIAGYERNVVVFGNGTDHTQVTGNRIGTVASGGTGAIENVRFDGSPQPTISGNTIVGVRAGGSDLAIAGRMEIDVVAGSKPGTVGLSFRTPGSSASTGGNPGIGARVTGNTIGLDQLGAAHLQSFTNGILLWSDAAGATIAGNRVAGHGDDEIEIYGGGTNAVDDNIVGLLGTPVSRGVTLHSSAFSNIGVGAGNTVGDSTTGILLDAVTDTQVKNNRVGVDVAGTTAHPNNVGIEVRDGLRTSIEGNQISGNQQQGILASGPASVADNRIGTTGDGTAPIPNGVGILVARGNSAVGANVIAFNRGRGVDIAAGAGAAVVTNSIFGNGQIGIDNRDNLPAAPAVAGVFRPASTGTTTRTWVLVRGLPTTGDGKVELFGNDDCSGAPQGRVVLVTLGALDPGKDYRLFTVLGHPELHGYTATFTDTGSVRTSDISGCVSDATSTDGDADGVPDGIEALGPFGPGAAARQDQVAIPTDSGQFVGFQTSVGRFTSLKPVDTPSAPLPAGTSLAFGVVAFRIEGVAPGGTAGVTVALPTGATATGYLKYGPQSAGGASSWYSFAFDAASGTGVGAALAPSDYGDGVLRRAVALTFVDGRRGDANLAVDGVIDDPGGVADVPANQVPACAARTLTLAAGATSSVAPSCTDDSPSLTYSIATQGTKGTASVVAGQLQYVAGASATGTDTFSYRASDGVSDSAPATVTVTITSANAVPTCQPLAGNVAPGSAVDVSPACSDGDGDALTYAIASQGTKGTASIAGGKLHYVATTGATGTDSFTYTANDGRGGTSVPASVAITISSTPPPPAGELRVTVEDALVLLPPAARGNDDREADSRRRRSRDTLSRLGLPLDDRSESAGLIALGGTFRAEDGSRLRCGDSVTLALGPMTETVVGASFRNVLGQCIYARSFRDRDRAGLSLVILDITRGRWAAVGRPSPALTPAVLGSPVRVLLGIGSREGSASVTLSKRGSAWVLRD